jgi:signal transduction histidine kinase
MTTWYLVVLMIALCSLSIFAYVLLAQNAYHTITAPPTTYTTEVKPDKPIPSGDGITGIKDYQLLYAYSIQSEKLRYILDGSKSMVPISSPAGILLLDQRQFITDDTSGGQNVWIYYRTSLSDISKYELMIVLRSVDQTTQVLGRFTGVLMYALPVVVILAGFIGFLLLKRMLKPIDAIASSAQHIGAKDSRLQVQYPVDSEFGRLASILNKAFGRLQEAVDRERRIIADASHEIRGSLTVMQGEASLALRKTRSVEEYEKCLEIFSREGTHLSSIINRLMLLAQLDSNPDALNIGDVNLSELLRDLSSDAEVLCEEKNIAFNAKLKEHIWIRGDVSKLRELFLNLLDNGVKYTSSGGQLSLQLHSEEGYGIVDISDTGIGIAREHLGMIFNRFYQVGKDNAQRGAGLGLAICKRIVDLHGGKIEVHSVVGQGTTFSVFLPLIRKTDSDSNSSTFK